MQSGSDASDKPGSWFEWSKKKGTSKKTEAFRARSEDLTGVALKLDSNTEVRNPIAPISTSTGKDRTVSGANDIDMGDVGDDDKADNK